MPTEEQIRVRYGETDQMGHAYYAHYFQWFEQARAAWCREHGFTYKELEEQGYKLPIVEAQARYRGEVLYDDVIVVRIRLAELKRSALRFEYEIVNTANGKKTTEGYTWQVLMGVERKAISFPPELRALFEPGLEP